MTHAWVWAVGSDESRLNVSLFCEGQSQDGVHRPQLLKRKESRSGLEPEVRPSTYRLGQTGSLTSRPGEVRVQCRSTSTENIRTIRDGGTQDVHLDFHAAAPEL